MQGKTKSGFKFNVSKDVLDDMRLIEAIREADENPLKVLDVVDLILGENKEKLYDHVKTEDGRVPVGAVQAEITEIFKAFGQNGKNS